MRLIFVLLFSMSLGFSCSGDCLSCHPKLKATILTDKRHEPMLSCIGCHKEESGGQSACGNDCFACHPIEKIDPSVKEHQVIETCRNCHMNMPKQLNPTPQSSSDTTLQDLLFTN